MSVYEESDSRLTKGEQRLLDEFAKAAIQGTALSFSLKGTDDPIVARRGYDIAYSMLAERRRRLGENES